MHWRCDRGESDQRDGMLVNIKFERSQDHGASDQHFDLVNAFVDGDDRLN